MIIKDKIGNLVEEICNEISNFTDIAVIGMSSGADSTLVTCLCVKALGAENVFALALPNDYGLDAQRKAANMAMITASQLGLSSFDIVDIKQSADAVKNSIAGFSRLDQSRVLYGNISARIRMTTLYAYAQLLSEHFNKRVRVIGTDNLSENYAGYFTKYGDGGVDINPIGELFKSEVYQLLEYFRDTGFIKEENINRTPTANLWPGQTDEDEMGITYDELEKQIRMIMNGDTSTKAYKMYIATQHKRVPPPEIKLREKFCD